MVDQSCRCRRLRKLDWAGSLKPILNPSLAFEEPWVPSSSSRDYGFLATNPAGQLPIFSPGATATMAMSMTAMKNMNLTVGDKKEELGHLCEAKQQSHLLQQLLLPQGSAQRGLYGYLLRSLNFGFLGTRDFHGTHTQLIVLQRGQQHPRGCPVCLGPSLSLSKL